MQCEGGHALVEAVAGGHEVGANMDFEPKTLPNAPHVRGRKQGLSEGTEGDGTSLLVRHHLGRDASLQ